VSKPSRFYRDIDGILLLDKALGVSSNAALQQARALFNAAKAGHAGSLDPLASGLLPVCFGQATKVCGRLASFLGEQQQVPPMHSALKFEGKRLYELARRGESVEREPRRIFIHRIARVRLERAELEFDVYCSKGTYIRTLAGDVANRLGTLGYVRGLRRLTLDPFDDLPMYTMEQLAERSHAARDEVLLPSDRAFPDLPRVDLDPGAVAALLQGRTVAARQRAAPGELRAYDDGGRFLGVVQGAPEGRVRPVRLFVDVAAS